MKRIIISVVTVLILSIVIMGCTQKKEATAKPIDIVTKISEEIEMPSGMLLSEADLEVQKDMINQMMGSEVDMNKIESFATYSPLMNISSQEFGVFKLKDEKDTEYIQKLIDTRIKSVQQVFEHYLIDQYEIAKKGQIKTDGKYVYYAMTAENETVFEKISVMLEESKNSK